LATIKRLKSDLANVIKPDHSLLDDLLSLEVLTDGQRNDISRHRMAYERNNALLDLLVSEDRCDKFLVALQRTGQQHIVDVITRNGGQDHCRM